MANSTVLPREETCGVILTRPDYYTIPPLNKLKSYKNAQGRCVVKGFTIGRIKYGNIYFPDEIDLTDINLDDIVFIQYRSVTVYPDAESTPPVGEGLNRRAQVTLDLCFPKDEHGKEVTDVADIIARDFPTKLRMYCLGSNTEFVDYRPDTGSYVFNVFHFTKYGFDEEMLEKYCKEDKDSDKKFKPISEKKDTTGGGVQQEPTAGPSTQRDEVDTDNYLHSIRLLFI